MKKHGFTLVELMGVIMILGVIALIAIPIVDRQLKESKDDLSKTQKENIKEAAKLWTAKNIYNLPTSGACYLRYSELVSSGFLDEELKDPKTNTPFTDENINIKIEKATDYNKYTYNVTSTKDDSIPYCQITVSFYDGETKLDSKTVVYHSTYGDLPTPTKEGYTFLGWHGKNILNLSDFIVDNPYVKVTDDKITIIKSNAFFDYKGNLIELIGNNQYTISAKIDGSYSGRIYGFFGSSLYYDDDFIVNTFTYSSTDDKGYFRVCQNTTANTSININLNTNQVTLSNIQLEQGSTATEYEPYYITPSTTVVQKENHALTAVWQEND